MIHPGEKIQNSGRDEGLADIDYLVKELESKFPDRKPKIINDSTGSEWMISRSRSRVGDQNSRLDARGRRCILYIRKVLWA